MFVDGELDRAEIFISRFASLALKSACSASSYLEMRDFINDMDSCMEKQLLHPLWLQLQAKEVEEAAGIDETGDGMPI